jgi:hypothetical protein
MPCQCFQTLAGVTTSNLRRRSDLIGLRRTTQPLAFQTPNHRARRGWIESHMRLAKRDLVHMSGVSSKAFKIAN